MELNREAGCRWTPKQAAFVQEYLVDLNATQAAIRAGYSEESAAQIGSENLAKPEIKAAIQEAMDNRAARTFVTQDRIVVELARLGFANMLDYLVVPETGDPFFDLTRMTRDQAAALTEVVIEETTTGRDNPVTTRRIRIKLADKRAALAELARHLGIKSQVEHSGVLTLEQLVAGSMAVR